MSTDVLSGKMLREYWTDVFNGQFVTIRIQHDVNVHHYIGTNCKILCGGL